MTQSLSAALFGVLVMVFCVGGARWLYLNRNPPRWVLYGLLATLIVLSIMAAQITMGLLAR